MVRLLKEKMSRESGYRVPFEFTNEVRNQVLEEQNNRCAVTGRKDHLQCHHLLPISIALGFWPNINPEIIKQRENAIYLNEDIHNQIHEEMKRWPPEFFKLVVIGMYKHLRDNYQDGQPVEVDNWPIRVENRV